MRQSEWEKYFFKTARLLRTLSDVQLLELGFPLSSLPYIRMRSLFPESVISRFDFAVTDGGIKMLEFNSDTPTFIMECFQINGAVCKAFDCYDPNKRARTSSFFGDNKKL